MPGRTFSKKWYNVLERHKQSCDSNEQYLYFHCPLVKSSSQCQCQRMPIIIGIIKDSFYFSIYYISDSEEN